MLWVVIAADGQVRPCRVAGSVVVMYLILRIMQVKLDLSSQNLLGTPALCNAICLFAVGWHDRVCVCVCVVLLEKGSAASQGKHASRSSSLDSCLPACLPHVGDVKDATTACICVKQGQTARSWLSLDCLVCRCWWPQMWPAGGWT